MYNIVDHNYNVDQIETANNELYCYIVLVNSRSTNHMNKRECFTYTYTSIEIKNYK